MVAEEEECDDAADALEDVVAVLSPLFGEGGVVHFSALGDDEPVDGVEDEGEPDEGFESVEDVLGHPFEELDDSVVFIGAGDGEAVQSEVLHHVEASRDDPG